MEQNTNAAQKKENGASESTKKSRCVRIRTENCMEKSFEEIVQMDHSFRDFFVVGGALVSRLYECWQKKERRF